MTKRMTLLARKDGLAVSDFRNYWAGPHANLALGMQGITRYVQNRVDKVLWASGGTPVFQVDGIVELSFAGAEAMRLAQAAAVGNKFIPQDEPNFLKGWTLCVVETEGVEPTHPAVKVIIPFHAPAEAREALGRELGRVATARGIAATLNWTVSTASRERLWSEPKPPSGFLCVWFDSIVAAHEAFDAASHLRGWIEARVTDAAAYLIDVLPIR